MNYTQASNLTSSEKISLVTCEAVRKAKLFTLYSGTTYYADFKEFCIGVKNGSVVFEVGAGKDLLTSGEFFYDIAQKRLYVNCGGNPAENDLIITHKLFFSTTPLILPHDLSSGSDVEWLPIVSQISSIGQELDDENAGIVLESQSNVTFVNNHGIFDDVFDSLIFENQTITFYSWFDGLTKSEIKKIFQGVVESKSFSPTQVRFNVKDQVYKLRASVKGPVYDTSTDPPEDMIGKPMRRIYGKLKQLKTVPTNTIGTGYFLGIVSISTGSVSMTGSGTYFLENLKQEDEVIIQSDDGEVKVTVESVLSSTGATLSSEADLTVTNKPAFVIPGHGYRFKNRTWSICGHKIRRIEQAISSVINARTFGIADTSEFYPGDIVYVYGYTQSFTVQRKNEFSITLSQELLPVPAIGTLLIREAVNTVYIDGKKLQIDRDYVLQTFPAESWIELNEYAEFNVAKEARSSNNFEFKHNDREVKSASTPDLRTLVNVGDFIRPETQPVQTPEYVNWYEVSSVTEKSILLTRPYNNGSGTNVNSICIIRKMQILNDESNVLVDCYGMDRDNKWVKTASDVVLDMITNDCGFTNVNSESFTLSDNDCNYIMSLAIPDIGSDMPSVRDTIVKINNSVFGSLYFDINQDISYSIVNTRKPVTIKELRDDDVLSWSVKTEQRIISDVSTKYRPYTDVISGDSAFEAITYSNPFVDNLIGIDETANITLYLHDTTDADTVTKRLAFYRSLSGSVINLSAKANFFDAAVNDMVMLDLDRIYRRYGGSSYKKIGIVSGIKKSQYNSEVSINDLGNIFNRCPSVGPSRMSQFTDASDSEKIKYGFILDSDTLIPGNDENYLGSGLIG